MKKIDTHIHFAPEIPHFTELAQASRHEYTASHLAGVFAELDIVHAVVMGNRGLRPGSFDDYPAFLSYCAGLHKENLEPDVLPESIALAEENLRSPRCVGLKIYAGYCPLNLNDPIYFPFYELAATYQKPVAVHTGTTAHPRAFQKYSHPLQLDDVAVLYPQVQFVMCHFGNPWLMDAAAVLEKNENVVADLSGLLVGYLDMPVFTQEQAGYIQQLKTWIAYVDDYDKFMYGTDWPLANMRNYIDFITMLIPERHLENVFYNNAARVYAPRVK
ncbi:MAG: amidohydrolase family protein [Synergistaceae bacterium]|jgi:predicted TIM-barrel fold metal-dependent hydrolase|nr:amidohydrolase family protein [Synergistaceae bacterium]